jgi:Trypsin-like peptidase domain
MVNAVQSGYSPRDFLGIILNSSRTPIGTCFQIASGVLVTAYHVIEEAGAAEYDHDLLFEPIDGGEAHSATIKRIDDRNDIAVLTTNHPLRLSVSHLAYSEVQIPDTPLHMVGYGLLPETHYTAEHRYLPTIGSWEGTSRQPDGTILARGRADGVAVGMSGCPILRNTDNAVLGILSKRYNTADGWSRGRIWISRIEDLEPLLAGLVQVAIERTQPKLSVESSWLTATSIDRRRLLDSRFFFQPIQWSDAWKRGSDAMNNGKVLVVAAPPGVGATTFAEQLLARVVDQRMRLMRLDPGDWDEPSASVLPIRPWHAYVLDLRDPEHDVPSATFVDSIGQSASEYRDMMSRLVITITEDLWLGKSSRLTADIELVRLHHPPDPKDLIKRYLEADAPRLGPLVELEDFAKHLEGMNAVQAMQMIDRVQQIASDIQPADSEEYASLVQQRVLEALDDHLVELSQLFGDPDDDVSSRELAYGRGQEREPILGLQDRCLLIALAFQGARRLSWLQEDTRTLVETLLGKSTPARPSEILTRAGVQGRINRIKAVTGHSETVTFKQGSFGDAAVRYVWNNYPPVRRSLAEWLVNLSANDGDNTEMAIRRLSELIQQHQDIDFLKDDLVRLTRGNSQDDLLASVTYNSAVDPHTRRRCERMLYDWAVRPDLQGVVISVCERLLFTEGLSNERRSIALTRLKRVADSERTSDAIRNEVLRVFRKIANSELLPWFVDATRTWRQADTAAVSARLAFAVTIPVEINGIPWLLTPEAAGPETDQMLGDLLANVGSSQGAYRALEDLLYKASVDNALYENAINTLASGFIAHGAIMPLFNVSSQLESLGRKIGRSPFTDISTRIRMVSAQSTPVSAGTNVAENGI